MKTLICSALLLFVPAASLACAMPARDEVKLAVALEDIDALLEEEAAPAPAPAPAPEAIAEVAEVQPAPETPPAEELELPVLPLDPGFVPSVIAEAQG